MHTIGMLTVQTLVEALTESLTDGFLTPAWNQKFWIADVVAMFPCYDVKPMLVEAHRLGLITLNRCDLVEAFDPYMVEKSQTFYFGAEYHVVSR